MSEVVYQTMKQIGAGLGLSSHQVGRKLKDLGLRTDEGRPSTDAFDCGYVAQKWTADGTKYLWAWHRDKTLKALAAMGVRPKVEKPSDPPK